LTRVVEAVGKPHLEVAAGGGIHDVDAFGGVGDGLSPHPLLDVAQAAQQVVVVLKGIGVDRSQPHPEVLGVTAKLVEVVDPVPGDVECDRWGETGVQVDLRGVGHFLEWVSRHPWLGEHLEPRAGVPERPRRQLDRLLLELTCDLLEAGHTRLFRVRT
jgi:hypothetical protein